MKFFESEVVRSELIEISELQQEVYKNFINFSFMSTSEKIEHIELLEELLKKQQVLYTRLSLSDDPEAKKIKQTIVDSAKLMGFPSNIDINLIFNDAAKMLESMKDKLDKIDSEK